MLKKIGLGLFALALSAGGALAQYATQAGGTGFGYPTLGVPADTQCLRFGNGGVCNAFAPAGPTALNGFETIIADTHTAAGSIPQTINTPVMGIGGGKFVLNVPLTGDTITIDAFTRQLIVNPAGGIAALTVNLPAASATMVNGQRFGMCGTQIVTALTLGAGTGNTFNPTQPTAMLVPVVTGAASCFEFIYSKTSATAGVWFRTQ